MRSGSKGSVTPVILVLLGLFGLFVVALFDHFQEAVLTRRGQAAAQAVSVGFLSWLYPLDGMAPLQPVPDTEWERWEALAQGNGLSDLHFFPLEPNDVAAFPLGVEVAVESREPGTAVITVQARAVPAGRVDSGRLYEQGGGLVYPVGCLPLGIPHDVWAQPSPPGDFLFPLGGPGASVLFVQFVEPTASPLEYLRFLQQTVAADPSGVAPPAVEVGDVLTGVSPSAMLIELEQLQTLARPQIIPLMRADEVVGFGLAHVLEVDGLSTPPTVRLARAPSALVPGVKSSWRADGNPELPALPDAFLGWALRPQVEFL